MVQDLLWQNIFFHIQQRSAALCTALRPGYTLGLTNISPLEPLLSPDCSSLLAEILSPEELAKVQGFPALKRKREWLAGRICSKYALLNTIPMACLDVANMQDITILPDELGRPVLRMKQHLLSTEGTQPAISITHSKDMAAVLITHNARCGIDIQQKQPRLQKVQEYFTAPNEVKQVSRQLREARRQEQCYSALALEELDTLTRIWAVKEAVKKSFLSDSSTTFSSTTVEQIHPTGLQTCTAICHIQDTSFTGRIHVHLIDVEDYILAYTAEQEIIR